MNVIASYRRNPAALAVSITLSIFVASTVSAAEGESGHC